MNRLEDLLSERGLKNEYLAKELDLSYSTYYRKKKDGTFTYHEVKKILDILGKIKSVSFEDLNGSSGVGNG